ncbi:MAG: hypothetical protein WDW36_010331 [Sanguina aurantia]
MAPNYMLHEVLTATYSSVQEQHQTAGRPQQPSQPLPLSESAALPASRAAAVVLDHNAGAVSAVRPRAESGSSSGSSGSSVFTIPAVLYPTLYLKSKCLEDMIVEINSCTTPTTFDLGGRTLLHLVSDTPAATIVITADNITLRNGTLHQSDSNSDKAGPGLHVRGVNMKLEGMVLMGGGYGLLVLPGGSASLNGCAVIGAYFGLGVGDFGVHATPGIAELEARDVKVTGCGGRGLSVGRKGSATVHLCEFKNGQHHGMFVGGDSESKLKAVDTRCNGNKKRGLCVIAQGKARLTRCNLTGNECGSLFVQGEGSVVRHTQSTLDVPAEEQDGGSALSV